MQPDKVMKMPAHKSSNGRATLNTLQKRKKCPVVKAITKLTGGYVLISAKKREIPMTKTITSNIEMRKPGANFEVAGFTIYESLYLPGYETKIEFTRIRKAASRRDGENWRWKARSGFRW